MFNFSSVLSYTFAFVFLSFICSVSPGQAFAQSSSGVQITPAMYDELVDPGDSLEFVLSVKNVSDMTLTYYLIPRNIIGAQNNGAPIIAKNDSEKTGYELADWLSLSVDQLTIEPQQESSVVVQISVPDDAVPGGHFGGVFISREAPKVEQSGAAVGYEVGNIISLRVSGEAEDAAAIRSFSTGNYIYSTLDIDFIARIENLGNTLIRPQGPLEIENMFGTKVATVVFNEVGAGIFPRNTREFYLDWKGEGIGLGRYTAKLSLAYGLQGARQTMTNSVSFWVLPMDIILPALGVLGVLLLAVVIGVRVYIKSQLRMIAGAGRRLRQQRRTGLSSFFLVFISMLVVTTLFLLVLLVLFA